jgi:hypothetical protein
MTKLTDKLRIADEVVARQVGAETVILHLARGIYFGLNPVGARVWQLLGSDAPRTLAQVCDVLVEEFDVSREILEADVLRIADELLTQGLVERVD